MPQRIQLRRTRGWRLPPGAVVVARPTRWGNPYRVGDVDEPTGRVIDAAMAVRLYRLTFRQTVCWAWRKEVRRLLAGRDLACWCPPDRPCHADVLLEIANDTDGGAMRRNDEWLESQERARERWEAEWTVNHGR